MARRIRGCYTATYYCCSRPTENFRPSKIDGNGSEARRSKLYRVKDWEATSRVYQDFDFFYFVQQWPGSYCDTKRSCCYPKTGKPAADFSIHGLWPNYNDGSYPSNCDPDTTFDPSAISDLTSSLETNWPSLACPSSDGLSFWSHEWEKHGTCSESVLDQHGYFEGALKLKKQVNLLQALESAGIKPDGSFYSMDSITKAITEATGFTPGIECNVDKSGKHQLYQIYLCVDTSGSNFIECSVLPKSQCGSQVEFPPFGNQRTKASLASEQPNSDHVEL